MAIVLIILASVFVGALGLHAYKRYRVRQQHRMDDNEYQAAVTVWEYSRVVEDSIASAVRTGEGVLDFAKISVPHAQGYKLSLELIGTYFRVHAIPNKYNKTGQLSFVADNTLMVRAADHFGAQASADDPEYKGEDSA
jgi:hypothetical protein